MIVFLSVEYCTIKVVHNVTANFCTRKDKGEKETDYWSNADLKKNVKAEANDFMYVTLVPKGNCKPGLSGQIADDFDRNSILSIVDQKIVCDGSCQDLDVMSAKPGKLSLVERNQLNFLKITNRLLEKPTDTLYKRTFGYYFEGIADVKSIGIGFTNEKAAGISGLKQPSGTSMWNFYTSVQVKLKLNGKTKNTQNIIRLAVDQTGILHV